MCLRAVAAASADRSRSVIICTALRMVLCSGMVLPLDIPYSTLVELVDEESSL
jgi:hypothetical protein